MIAGALVRATVAGVPSAEEVPATATATATPLTTPHDGVPEVITTATALAAAAAALAAGSGPTAVDAERASGYRYGQHAYLIQLRRTESGTFLIDPTPFTDLEPIAAAIADSEWILHAANQDLACLAEVGLVPAAIFDTEVAARILGKPRVGLAALVESELGFHLAKEHSAADWSTRPLPTSWLNYAALDVELLIELRARLADELAETGRQPWATEEFEHVLSLPQRQPHAEPWRRTSGIHRVRTGRQLAIVRSLWLQRDSLAAQLDRAPGRVLPDHSVIAAARAAPRSAGALGALPEFSGRGTRRRIQTWWTAVAAALELADDDLPASRSPQASPPPAKSWSDKNPSAGARLAAARSAIADHHRDLGIPAENLLTPDAVRQLCWAPPMPLTRESVATALSELGARRWQIELCSGAVFDALVAHA